MPSGQLNAILRQLCRLVGASSVEELSDRQLLEAFAQHHDAASFEVLVQRHGPLVLGVCRRVLHDEHDAEDAFQATFLVLARKADSIRKQEAVGSWLCGTAYRLALKARAASERRREQERQAEPMKQPDPDGELAWRELRPVLDEELNRLPQKYRAPLVLCYLQGKTNEMAARELGWPTGSMSYRLAQARDKLRARLVQRGVVLSAAGLAAVLAQHAQAAVQAPLVDATVRASVAFATGATAAGLPAKVVALAEVGLQAIRLAQLRLIALVALGVVVLVGGGGLVVVKSLRGTGTANPPATRPDTEPDPRPRLLIAFSESQRFGLACAFQKDQAGQPKLLTREASGTTNNTCFRIDGRENLFGILVPGIRWARDRNNAPIRNVKVGEYAWQSAIEEENTRVRITQTVELIRGEQTGLRDTVLVKYHIRNGDKAAHNVGLRFMLDTLIGENDGTPFLVPPTDEQPARMVDALSTFERASMPEFIRALEADSLEDTNATVAELNLKLQGYEPLDRLVICRWPDNSEARWSWTYRPMNDPPERKDSCVVLYWADRAMQPGEERTLGFTYGLGQIYGEGYGGSPSGGRPGSAGKMRLLTAGSARIGRAFTATLYVRGETLVGQKASLRLPPGLELVEGQSSEQVVPRMGPQGYTQVSWRVRSTAVGQYTLEAELAGDKSQREMFVRELSLFE